tara:strand:+ start:1502 stop:3187 length:1686 start_codon:yes stop_codon:yes gene_type:complete
MYLKKIKFILIIFLFYQTPLYSKSTSFNNFNSKNLSKYFSGIVAFENKENTSALEFFSSSKILLNQHEPYLKRYVYSLVLENKISQAVNVVKKNKDKNNSNFFDAHLLLILNDLKKNELENAYFELLNISNSLEINKFDAAILENLRQYIYVFKENKFLDNKKDFGKLSRISETFQKCYLGDQSTDDSFSNLFNDLEIDYSRYIYFYLTYLVENSRVDDAKNLTNDLNYINTTLLLSQGKDWIENGNAEKLVSFFSCKNPNDIIGEFLFLISNLYSSQDNFKKSNFFLNLSNFLNPKFIFNLSLISENQYLNGEYNKAKKTLKNFNKEHNFYYWYRVKKEAQIIAKQRNNKESLNYIAAEFNKIDYPNDKILFDIANFYKRSKEYNKAIEYYTKIIDTLNDSSEIKSDLLYRRGGSYERMGQYEKADKDLLYSLKINPDDAYVLNYLAYSWLERDYKIGEAIEMLKTAYSYQKNDPYIIDSIGWAYYLVNDYTKAESFLKRAVLLMPEDAIVNDHYGDILWKLDRKIQARYFWASVLKMDNADDDMIKKVNIKISEGLTDS